MKRRAGTLLAAAGVLTALVVPASSPAAAKQPNPSATAAVEPLTILKAGYDAFSTFRTCLKNIDVGQPCLATDSDNIRAILKEVRQLSAQIEVHQKETRARLQLLQRTLDTSVLDEYINALRPEALNGRSALKAWERISVCMEQSTLKRKTCQGVNGRVKSVKAAVAGWKQELITQADFTSSNVELTGAQFAGTEDRGGENGLAYAAWILNKRLQDEQAGVTNPAQLNSKTVPVVTRQLAAAQNFFVDYYVDVLDTYGFIKPLAEGLKNRPRVAQSIQRRVQTEIYGTGQYSVATAAKRMALTRLQTGQILYRGAPDNKAWVVADYSSVNPYSPLQPSGVVKLANAINSYGKVSDLRASNPDSFPDKGWYSVQHRVAHPTVCPRRTTWCSSDRNLYRTEYRVTQLMRSGGVVRPIGVRPVDSRPGWNNAWYENPYGAMGINFKKEFDHFVTGAAEFHWNVRKMGSFTPYQTWDVGPGAWVIEHKGTANRVALPKVPFLMRAPL
jgi:hypothetical protein